MTDAAKWPGPKMEDEILTWLKTQAILKERKGLLEHDQNSRDLAARFQTAADCIEGMRWALDQFRKT